MMYKIPSLHTLPGSPKSQLLAGQLSHDTCHSSKFWCFALNHGKVVPTLWLSSRNGARQCWWGVGHCLVGNSSLGP